MCNKEDKFLYFIDDSVAHGKEVPGAKYNPDF